MGPGTGQGDSSDGAQESEGSIMLRILFISAAGISSCLVSRPRGEENDLIEQCLGGREAMARAQKGPTTLVVVKEGTNRKPASLLPGPSHSQSPLG